ncbi:uncharacterized protein STEHIDRAFT_120280, partial [Stereum hirsutum FP-91666 SS1]|uniref:uncharacterized protein n=1 Tax=Stereum hirsutum (strain FP-91666) TaxID=721885 RepID=UPI000440F0EB
MPQGVRFEIYDATSSSVDRSTVNRGTQRSRPDLVLLAIHWTIGRSSVWSLACAGLVGNGENERLVDDNGR